MDFSVYHEPRTVGWFGLGSLDPGRTISFIKKKHFKPVLCHTGDAYALKSRENASPKPKPGAGSKGNGLDG